MPLSDSLCVVIMAGGGGTRLWPVSRDERPKAFLDFKGKTLLQRTYARARLLAPAERIFVLALDRYAGMVEAQLPELPPQNRLNEPLRKNTGPALAHAMAALARLQGPETPVLVLPSDQMLLDELFTELARGAADELARHRALFTFGIAPTRPAVEFGYLEADPRAEGLSHAARRFVEKPDASRARELLAGGNHFWNAGIFLWTVAEFERQLRAANPGLHDLFFTGREAAEAFGIATALSIDYALMERAERVRVIPFTGAWTDVGSWQAVWEYGPRDADENYVDGPVTLRGCRHSLVVSDKPLRVSGLESMVLVVNGGETLCCPIADTPELGAKFWERG